MALRRRDAPTLLLGAAMFVAAVLLIAFGWRLTFFQDAWSVLMERRPWDAHSLLAPFNEHLLVLQVLVEKAFVSIFGMGGNHPEMLFMVFSLLAAAALLFVYVRRCAGEWIALFATCLLLFLGTAWQVLLWPFEMNFAASLAAGIGMLLMLEREDRRGDVWACVLALVSVGFGSFGLSFAVAAFVDVCVRHRERGWRRVWIVVAPAILYLAWYAGWGHEAEHHLTLHNILASPVYTAEGLAAGLASLTGLGTSGGLGLSDPTWGRPLLVALVGVAIWAQRKRPGVAKSFWPVVAVGLSYWLLAGFNFIPGREADSVRYQYGGAAIVLLLVAELLRQWRFSPRALLVAAGATALMLGPNLAQFHEGYEVLRQQSVLARSDTAAIEIARHTVSPEFRLSLENSGTASLINVDAADYLAAVEEHGSPAYSPAELAGAAEPGRRWADVALAEALPLGLETVPGGFDPGAIGGAGCTAVPPGGAVPEVALGTGQTRIYVGEGGEAQLSLRRFAEGEYPVKLAAVPGGASAVLRVPRDEAPEYPWLLHVEAGQEAFVCTPAGSGGAAG
jgi:hypothetical protein